MNREYHKWWSPRLRRDMELLVFGHAGAKVLVFPTRGGRFHQYEDLRMVQQLEDKIERGWLQLYCVDSVDYESLYCQWAHPSGRIARHIEYEEYILSEVLPLMQSKNHHDCTMTHGCSLGAYHAVNIAFRHPHLFRKVVGFSGRYDLTQSIEWFGDLFDGYRNHDIYLHTPNAYVPHMHGWKLDRLRHMEIIIVTGEHDPFLNNNQHLSHVLSQKGVPHQLHVWEDRAHRGYYWRRMARIYI